MSTQLTGSLLPRLCGGEGLAMRGARTEKATGLRACLPADGPLTPDPSPQNFEQAPLVRIFGERGAMFFSGGCFIVFEISICISRALVENRFSFLQKCGDSFVCIGGTAASIDGLALRLDQFVNCFVF